MAVRTATINGLRMAYEVTGSGPPLAFIHGGFGGVESRLERARPWWVDELFAPHFTVITYDRRACGLSAITDDGYSLENFAADLRGLLAHLGIERAHVMGSSAGGPIALQYALNYAETVDMLVLINTAPDLLAGEQGEPLRRLLDARIARGPDALPEVPAEATPAERARVERLRDQVAALPAAERRRAFDAYVKTIAAYDGIDLSDDLVLLQMPVFIIHGSDDDLVPVAGAYKLSHAIRRSSTRIRAGEGHGLSTRREAGAMELVLEWLQRMEEWHASGGEEREDLDLDPDPRYE